MLVCFLSLRHIFFLFWLLPLGATTADNLPPSHAIPRLHSSYPNHFHVLLSSIHEPSLWSSFPPTWHLHRHHFVQYIHDPSSSHVQTISTLPLLLYHLSCLSDIFLWSCPSWSITNGNLTSLTLLPPASPPVLVTFSKPYSILIPHSSLTTFFPFILAVHKNSVTNCPILWTVYLKFFFSLSSTHQHSVLFLLSFIPLLSSAYLHLSSLSSACSLLSL